MHLLDSESRGQDHWHGVKGPGAAPPIYVHGTSNKDKRRYMNVLIRSVVDRRTECHGKEVGMTKSLGSNRNKISLFA